MNAIADLESALRILKQVYTEMPSETEEQLRLKCNLLCGLVYLEDGIRDIKGE